MTSVDTVKMLLSIAPDGEVTRLLSKYGYARQSVTPELVLEAISEDGSSFGSDLAEICRKGLKNRVTANRLANYTSLSYATGDAEATTIVNNTGSTTTSANSTYQWFDRIFGFLEKGIVAAPQIINGLDVSGSNSANAQANQTLAQALLADKQGKNNTTLYVALGFVVLLVIGVIVYVTVRKKK